MTDIYTPSIDSLISRLDIERESHHTTKGGVLRIDLKLDDLRLWRETLAAIVAKPCNLLLACEDSNGALQNTRLTWVVGSAIRPGYINNPREICALLESLGVTASLAAIVPQQCPGLGCDVTWAFYLERHGWLTASPVLSDDLTPVAFP